MHVTCTALQMYRVLLGTLPVALPHHVLQKQEVGASDLVVTRQTRGDAVTKTIQHKICMSLCRVFQVVHTSEKVMVRIVQVIRKGSL